MGFEVADKAVEVCPCFEVVHAAMGFGREVDDGHAASDVGEGEVDGFGQLDGGEVVVVGVETVEDGVEGGFFNEGEAFDVGVEEEAAAFAELAEEVLRIEVGDGSVDVALGGDFDVGAPQNGSPKGSVAEIDFGAFFDGDVVEDGVAVIRHLFPTVEVETGVHEDTAVVGLEVDIGGTDAVGADFGIHGEVDDVES